MKYKLCLISLCGCRRWIQENLQWLRFDSALHLHRCVVWTLFAMINRCTVRMILFGFVSPLVLFFPFTIHYFLFFWRLLRSKRSRSMLISLFISLFFYFMHLLVTNFSANFLNPFHLQTYFAFECLSKSYLKYDSEFEREKQINVPKLKYVLMPMFISYQIMHQRLTWAIAATVFIYLTPL